jgi:hypothetical protein
MKRSLTLSLALLFCALPSTAVFARGNKFKVRYKGGTAASNVRDSNWNDKANTVKIPASAESLSGNPSGEISEQYDKFKDVTNVTLKPMPMPCPLGEEAWLTAQFSYPGRTLKRPDQVIIGFVFASKKAKFGQSVELIVLVDGERLRVGEMYRDVNFTSRHMNPVRETMAQIIPLAIFTRIAHAKKIEAQLGIFEFSLSDENLLALRELAARMASN